MNIVEDLGNFYKDNQNEILKSLELKDTKSVIFILNDNGIKSITKRCKDGKEFINKEYTNNSLDINLFKTVYYNSFYFFDDSNSCIKGGKKIISSTIPQVIKFANKLTKVSGIVEEKKDIISRLNKDLIEDEYNLIIEYILYELNDKDIYGREGLKDIFISYSEFKSVKLAIFKKEIETYYKELEKEFKNGSNVVFDIIKNGVLDSYINSEEFSYLDDRDKEKYQTFYKNIKNIFNDIKSVIIDDKVLLKYNELEISDGTQVYFIFEEDDDKYKTNYTKYLDTRFYLKDSKNNERYSASNGSNPKKNFYYLNINNNFENYYYGEKNNLSEVEQEYLLNYAKFMNIIRYIPNKFLVIDDNFVNVFDKTFKDDDIIKEISNKTSKKDLKVLHTDGKGDINFYDYINTTNLYFKYKNNDGRVETINNYDFYKRIIHLTGKSINFFGDNSKTTVENIHERSIYLHNLYDSVKNELYRFVYLNDKNVNLFNIINCFEVFIMNNELFLYKDKSDKKIKISVEKIKRLVELKNNIMGENINFTEIEKNVNKIKGYVYFDNMSLLNENLNDVGKKFIESNDKDIVKNEELERFKKNINSLKVNMKYLKNNYSDYQIENDELYSYTLGILISYQQLYSGAINANITTKFKNKSNGETVCMLIDNHDKFKRLMDYSISYNKLYTSLIKYAYENEKSNIDYKLFNVGYYDSKKYLNKN